jgi:hypothetical protein
MPCHAIAHSLTHSLTHSHTHTTSPYQPLASPSRPPNLYTKPKTKSTRPYRTTKISQPTPPISTTPTNQQQLHPTTPKPTSYQGTSRTSPHFLFQLVPEHTAPQPHVDKISLYESRIVHRCERDSRYIYMPWPLGVFFSEN